MPNCIGQISISVPGHVERSLYEFKQKPHSLEQGFCVQGLCSGSAALAAGAALISAGMSISARLRTEQLSIFFDCRVQSNGAIAGLAGTGWGWDRHGQTSLLRPF